MQDWFGASDEAMEATGFNEWTASRIDLFGSPTGLPGRDFTSNNYRLMGCFPNPADHQTNLEYFL